MSTKGILKAGNKIQTNLTGASNYNLKVGGVSVSSATSSITLGPYEDDQFYELTVNSGAVSVSCYDALINGVTTSVSLADLGSAQSAGVGAERVLTGAFAADVTSVSLKSIPNATNVAVWYGVVTSVNAAPAASLFPTNAIIIWNKVAS